MWQLDELNYTTLAIAPKTTAITKGATDNSKHDVENNFVAFVTATIKSRQVKQGLYRGLDTSVIFAPMKNIPPSKESDEDADLNFQVHSINPNICSPLCILNEFLF
uniref:Retrovirus-related Pol polyprotein from transposon TNT 1-94 n=1 Tax=Heterorhabditis bacteriophora TaxID=37862 RepID=A0A1I7WNJ1_HETBA